MHARPQPANDREGPITPAQYLRLCREAAGLSRADVADRLQRLALSDPRRLHPIGRRPAPGEARELVDLLEADHTRARFRTPIVALASIYPLDVDVYFQLRDEPADRHPTICRTCGCSPNMPCHGDAGVCTVEAHSTTCSRCQGHSVARRAA